MKELVLSYTAVPVPLYFSTAVVWQQAPHTLCAGTLEIIVKLHVVHKSTWWWL